MGMLLEKTWAYIEKHRLILPGEKILVGFSGGADSVCLLLLLAELGQQKDFSVHAVHVNHSLRGEESDADQAFAEEFCRSRKIPLECVSVPVRELAQELGMGIEEAGRAARIRVFRQCAERFGADRTALAHHRNDQAETLLFRLARGSSLGGLSGIRPLQEGVIHPLLFAGKEEILRELEERGETYRTDSSNLTDHYTRNCIRHRVLPVLEERVNDRSISHMAEAAEDIREADDFLRRLAEPLCEAFLLPAGSGLLLRQELIREEPVLVRYVLMEALGRAAGGRRNLGREQISQLADLMKGETGRRCSLPGETEAVRTYEGVILRKGQRSSGKRETGRPDQQETSPVLQIRDAGQYRMGNWRIQCQILSSVPAEIPEKTYTKWLDYDKIKDNLEFRTRRPGDFLVTTKEGGRKKLKSYFIDEKIPAEKRGKLLLLASGSRVFWVAGYRISEDCKVTEETRQILKITISEEEA